MPQSREVIKQAEILRRLTASIIAQKFYFVKRENECCWRIMVYASSGRQEWRPYEKSGRCRGVLLHVRCTPMVPDVRLSNWVEIQMANYGLREQRTPRMASLREIGPM